MSGAGLITFILPPMPPPLSCVINFSKDENKLTRDGRDFLKEKVEFAATVISFSDFNVKMKEVMQNHWPMATLTTPTIKINGEVITPKCGPIVIANATVDVSLKTTTKFMDAEERD